LKKKYAAIVITSILACTIVAGCSGKKSNDSATSQSQKSATNDKDSDITIEIVAGDTVQLPPEGENFIEKGLSEAIGSKVKLTILGTGNDYDSALNVRLTSGEIPDLFMIPNKKGNGESVMTASVVKQYADSNLIMSLNPYLDQLKPMFKVTGEPRETDKYKDNAYLIPTIGSKGYSKEEIAKKPELKFQKKGFRTYGYLGIMYRNDWLEKVGSTIPKTSDEFINVCEKFTNDDPDGNGKKDTYGLSGKGLAAFNPILNAYGASANSDIIVEDGKVTSTLESKHMTEALEMCKKLVDTGAVDPDLLSNTASTVDDKAIQGFNGITVGSYAGIMRKSTQDEIHSVNKNADWKLMDSLSGPSGKQFGNMDLTESGGKTVIGKNVEKDKAKLQKIFDLLNYLASVEGQRLVCYGEEGVHYNLEDGKITPTDKMASETNFTYVYQLIGRDDEQYLITKFPEWNEIIPFSAKIPRFTVYNNGVEAPEGFYLEDFNKYVNEELTKFIYGKRPISEYKDFLSELDKTFGYQEYMKSAAEQLKEKGFIDK